MNSKLKAGAFAPLLLMSLAAAAQAGSYNMPEQSLLNQFMGTHPRVMTNGPTSFDLGAAEVRRTIAEREKTGVISAQRADRLNRGLDRAIALRDQYVAQGRRLTPEQINTLRSRLNGIRAAVRQRLQYY